MITRLVLACALVACSSSDSKTESKGAAAEPAEPAAKAAGGPEISQRCREYVELVAQAQHGQPDGHFPTDEPLAFVVGPPAPHADWKPLPKETFQRAVIAETIVRVEPERADFANKWYPRGEWGRQLRGALQGYVKQELSGGVVYVELINHTPIERAYELARKVKGVELRLMVNKPPGANLDFHLTAYSRTPERWVNYLRENADATVFHVLEHLFETSAGCPQVQEVLKKDAFAALAIDTFGDLSKALTTCRCQMADVDGFISLLMYTTMPYPSTGWVALDPNQRSKP